MLEHETNGKSTYLQEEIRQIADEECSPPQPPILLMPQNDEVVLLVHELVLFFCDGFLVENIVEVTPVFLSRWLSDTHNLMLAQQQIIIRLQCLVNALKQLLALAIIVIFFVETARAQSVPVIFMSGISLVEFLKLFFELGYLILLMQEQPIAKIAVATI